MGMTKIRSEESKVEKYFTFLGTVLWVCFFLLSAPISLHAQENLNMSSGEGVSGPGAPASTETVPQLTGKAAVPGPRAAPRGEFKGVQQQKQQELPAQSSEQQTLRIFEQDPAVMEPAPLLNKNVYEGYAPSQTADFRGIGYTGWIPPDPVLAVGPNHIVAMVNSSWAVFDKDGNNLAQIALDDWWEDVFPPGSPFDPVCIYDMHAGRWVLLAVAANFNTRESSYLLSVSDDADPFGDWWLWKLDATYNNSEPTDNWADYPKIGYDSLSVSDGAVYITSNQFSFSTGNPFQYAKLRIIPKSELYWTGSGYSLNYVDIWDRYNEDGSKVSTWMPVHTLSFPGVEFLVNTESPAAGDAVTLWSLSDPTGSPPTLTRVATLPIGSYSAPPDADQPGSGSDIDTIDSRLMQPAVYRMNHVYCAFPEAYNWGSGTVSAIRYLKIDTVTPAVVHNTTYGADGFYYYFPSVYVDNSDNVAMVFNRSSASEFAGIRYTGRLSTDTSMQASASLKAGESSYQLLDGIGRNRWGDYNGIGLDPSDGKTFWMISEYAKAFTEWDTWIGAVTFEDTPPPCKGDFNNDGNVDGEDLTEFANEFGRDDCPIIPE
jgi:hypothetical protein